MELLVILTILGVTSVLSQLRSTVIAPPRTGMVAKAKPLVRAVVAGVNKLSNLKGIGNHRYGQIVDGSDGLFTSLLKGNKWFNRFKDFLAKD